MVKYLRYQLKNIEPLRIADNSTSQSGQTNTLKYITGSAIRGAVITALVNHPNFEEIKTALFSSCVRFLNAYPSEDGKELLPSLKGFYEDKTKADGKKQIHNVMLEGKVDEGMKWAAVGEFCYLKDDTIHYYSVDTGSDLKIKFNLENPNEKRNVFRNDYISAGHIFTGYIVIADDKVKDLIESVFGDELILGNARSSGLGKCEILSKNFVSYEDTPFAVNAPSHALKDKCYMMLYSHTVMRDETGEYAGLHLKALEKKLGVSELRIEYCATSTKSIHGYNRKLGVKIPSVPMYEQGSVFQFSYQGLLTPEKMREVMESGIGVRRNEGFGQVVFLKDYEQIIWKLEGRRTETGLISQKGLKKIQDPDTIRIAAANYYRHLLKKAMEQKIVEGMQKGTLCNSQIGKLEALITANKYNTENAKETIRRYFDHAMEKEQRQNIQKEDSSVKPLFAFVWNILSTSYAKYMGVGNQTIMGIAVSELLTEKELDRMKLEYLTELIRHDNRKGADYEGSELQ